MESLTPSLEDYLEAIWLIGLEEKVVRVKHISKLMKIRPASVVGAMRVLSKKGLVSHERYGYVELTNKGIDIAKKVVEKHRALFSFLHGMLGIEEGTAKKDACKIEHYISQKTFDRLVKFLEFVEDRPCGDPFWLSSFRYFAEAGKRPKYCIRRIEKSQEASTLSELEPGEEGTVVAIGGTDDLKRKLLVKGFAPGARVFVDGVPEGEDCVKVTLDGAQFPLHISEAREIKIDRE